MVIIAVVIMIVMLSLVVIAKSRLFTPPFLAKIRFPKLPFCTFNVTSFRLRDGVLGVTGSQAHTLKTLARAGLTLFGRKATRTINCKTNKTQNNQG